MSESGNMSEEKLLQCLKDKTKIKEAKFYIAEAVQKKEPYLTYISKATCKVFKDRKHFTPLSKLYTLRLLKDIFQTGDFDLIDGLH